MRPSTAKVISFITPSVALCAVLGLTTIALSVVGAGHIRVGPQRGSADLYTAVAHLERGSVYAPVRDALASRAPIWPAVTGLAFAASLFVAIRARVRAWRIAKARAAAQRISNVVCERERSERNLRGVIEGLPDAVLIQKRGVIQYVNPAALALFGHPRAEDLIGKRSIDLVHPDEREEVLRLRGESPRLPPRIGTRRFVNRDGSTLWTEHTVTNVEFDGEPAIALVIRDVTARHRAEQALHRTEKSFRTLIEHIPLGILVLRDEKVIYANTAWLRMCRVALPRDILGRDARDIPIEEERSMVEARLAGLGRGESQPAAEMRLRAEDGSTVRVESRSMRIEFDGTPCIAVVARDVGPEREMQKRLMLSDRMVSIGTLAAGVAHEINNPLAYILANLDFSLEMLRGPRASPDASSRADINDALEQAREGAGRVRAIVRDLKMFSRRDEETIGPVDLERVLESSINMAFNEIRHRGRLVKQFDAAPRVLANEARLGQIFLNLLVNAAQAIPDGDAESNRIFVQTSTDEMGRAVVSVKDTGEGMTPETQRRIFDPFFTTKPLGVGTGLGLAICQSIVQSLGGEIEVESVPGKGSTFRVFLPAAPSDACAPRGAVDAPMKAGRGRVLLVDDEPMIGRAMERLLAAEHEVIAVTRADVAKAKLESGERFDVILCDLMMPDVSGMEFHAWLRTRSQGDADAIIFLTGGVFTEQAAAFVSDIPNLRLEKPIDSNKLRAVVNERIAGRRSN